MLPGLIVFLVGALAFIVAGIIAMNSERPK